MFQAWLVYTVSSSQGYIVRPCLKKKVATFLRKGTRPSQEYNRGSIVHPPLLRDLVAKRSKCKNEKMVQV